MIRIFVCDKCCNTAYTTDGSIPGACTSQYWVRTSGICGGHYAEVEGADFNWVVNQEVDKRIAERMPSDELIEEIQEKSLLEYENAPICEIDYYSGFEDGVKWLRSRLTNPGDSQGTEGGTK